MSFENCLQKLNLSLSDLDIEIARRKEAESSLKSLRQFIRGAWAILEPGREYLHNWHIDCISEYLEAVNLGQIQQLVINMPPRHMKSIAVTVCFPCWVWANSPEKRFVAASYASSLAIKHNVDRRRVLKSDWYQRLYGDRFKLMDDNDQKTEFENDKRGVMAAVGVGGAATGKGGDILIADDPVNPKEASSDTERENANNWFDQTFSTRLDDKKRGSIIVVMQRLHENDLAGHLIEKGGWEHLNIQGRASERKVYVMPMSKTEIVREQDQLIWPEREGEEEHEKIKRNLGSAGYASQYQQEPAPATGYLFKKYHLSYWYPFGCQAPPPITTPNENGDMVICRQVEVPYRIDTQYQSWDCAFKGEKKNDYVVGQCWGVVQANRFLLDQIKGRMDFVGTLQAIREFSVKHPKAVSKLIEDKANGPAVISSLRNQIPGLIPIDPKGDKIQRADAVTPIIESGNVYLPHPFYFPWIEDLVDELCKFPRSKNDDQVDALTQFLNHIMHKSTNMENIVDMNKSKNKTIAGSMNL